MSNKDCLLSHSLSRSIERTTRSSLHMVFAASSRPSMRQQSPLPISGTTGCRLRAPCSDHIKNEAVLVHTFEWVGCMRCRVPAMPLDSGRASPFFIHERDSMQVDRDLFAVLVRTSWGRE